MKPRKAAYRLALYEAQRGRCIVCAGRLPGVGEPYEPVDQITIEHVTPIARGGRDVESNRALSHMRCNNAKGDRAPTGCELIALDVTLARLGRNPADAPRDDTPAPSALALALLDCGALFSR